MIDAHNLKKISWTLLTFLLSMMALGPSNLEYFWHLYLVVALLAILWTLYLVYLCERFTVASKACSASIMIKPSVRL